MNTGVVSSRYAKALLKYTQETGRSEQVCAQVQAILRNPEAAEGALELELQKFIALLRDNDRLDLVRLVFRDYVKMYYEAKDIILAHLTTVIPAPETEKTLVSMIEEYTGCKVLLDTSIDAGLIGGFVLEVDDILLDASVKCRLETVRRQFIISNNRIV